MTWFRVDDGWHSHPKVLAAGNAAAGLWARCGSYSAYHNLEGRVPKVAANGFGTKTEIARLVAAGLWVEHENHYVMPDWLDYNPSAEEVNERKAQRAEAGRLGGIRSGATRRSKHEANTKQTLPEIEAPSSHAYEANVNPDPTRPDPRVQVRDNSIPVDSQTSKGALVDNRLTEVARNYARIALDKAPHVNNPAAYATAAQRTALEHPDIGRYCERWPTAPPDAIAAWLHGDKHSQSYYHDTADDEIAPVHPIRGEAG